MGGILDDINNNIHQEENIYFGGNISRLMPDGLDSNRNYSYDINNLNFTSPLNLEYYEYYKDDIEMY
jgi:hypothetical protein